MQPEENPFFFKYYAGHPTYTLSVEDRLTRVREFTAEQCRTALAHANEIGLQKTVRQAIERRLRKFWRGHETVSVFDHGH
jgi:hypothetical protein